MSTRRNDPCPCGSGLKFKHCCLGRVPWYRQAGWTGFVLGLILLGGLIVLALTFSPGDEAGGGPPGAVPRGKVWSYEHGHWHDA